nr:MAG TPA: N-terminal acetyltransferase [Caudoviricetes sp.]
MKAVPLERKDAAAFVEALHRHHPPAHGDKFRIGCEADGKLVGVVQVGRPVSRVLDDGHTLEVLRLCTDGTRNACSFLYSRAARVAKELGYSKIITYILSAEDGGSLRASGWRKEADIREKDWSCPSRPRKTDAPTCDKQRWAMDLTGGTT